MMPALLLSYKMSMALDFVAVVTNFSKLKKKVS